LNLKFNIIPSTTNMATKANSVAVIGAGPAGAIATDALVREQAFEKIRVFDRRPIIGGAW
jgi:cation diffusion facilitator CzcD-associated flavoprotein CzcO